MPRKPRTPRSLKIEGRNLATYLLVFERVMVDFSSAERRALIRRALASLDALPETERSGDIATEARKVLAGMLRTLRGVSN